MTAAHIKVNGSPASALRSDAQRRWRDEVAHAAAVLAPRGGLELAFTVQPGRWVDLDSLVHPVLSGLRDVGLFSRGYPQLHALLATRVDGAPGVRVTPRAAATLSRRSVPGPQALQVQTDTVPRPGALASKRHWRTTLAQAWGERATLDGMVWADVALSGDGSLLAPLEVVLDALEPVLGRDPRGQPRQEFFPNDHMIRWLRVRRALHGPRLALRLGRFEK